MAENFFKWDASRYSVNVHLIDSEHQKLIDYMNVLHAKVEQNASKEELRKALRDLGNYTLKHFTDEENLFMNIENYPLKEVHKKIHQDLLKKFTGYANEFETTGKLTDEFFLFLKVWLTAHIAGIDMKVGHAYNKKAA